MTFDLKRLLEWLEEPMNRRLAACAVLMPAGGLCFLFGAKMAGASLFFAAAATVVGIFLVPALAMAGFAMLDSAAAGSGDGGALFGAQGAQIESDMPLDINHGLYSPGHSGSAEIDVDFSGLADSL